MAQAVKELQKNLKFQQEPYLRNWSWSPDTTQGKWVVCTEGMKVSRRVDAE